MNQLILNIFVKENLSKDESKGKILHLAGIIGLVVNILLAIVKLIAGIFASSVSVIGDAINNFSDAGTYVVALVGIRLSEAPPDKEHPFGHGRIEYITSMVIAIIIFIAGVELAKNSFSRILKPQSSDFQLLTIIILALSILVKIWLMIFNNFLSKKVKSTTIKATVIDSRNDAICTFVLLVSGILGKLFNIHLDGIMGLGVSLLVIWSGISVLKDSLSPLIGKAPSKNLVQDIKKHVLSYDKVIGVHDIIIHNYGPERLFISLHAEVSHNEDMMKCHDTIDEIEQNLNESFGAITCIHMDPIDVDDPRIDDLRKITEEAIKSVDEKLNFHDFRVVFTQTHTNVIFDLVVPFGTKNAQQIRRKIQDKIWEKDRYIFVNIALESSYV